MTTQRVTVSVPGSLMDTVRERLPGINVSAIFQRALAAQLECKHEHVSCSSCSTPIDTRALIDGAMGALYLDAFDALRTLVQRGGTAEGAARVLRDIAQRHQVSQALRLPLPRPTRANYLEHQAQKIVPLPTEAVSKDRHPTARRTA